MITLQLDELDAEILLGYLGEILDSPDLPDSDRPVFDKLYDQTYSQLMEEN